jgi:HK97 family phage prohead protease
MGVETESVDAVTIERSLQREWRAKYTAKERKAMAGKEAMADESYPIKDKDDLEKAIKAVGRGNASHNSIRAHIIARAKALKLSSLIPDNWNSDGSLSEEDSVWSTLEERETYNDRRQIVQQAIVESLPKPKKGEVSYVYISDMTDDWAVYEREDVLWQVTYTVDVDDEVTLGVPKKVRCVTTYAPEANGRRDVENSTEDMEECPTCSGTGKVKGNSTECPDCDGTGEIEKDSRSAAQFELRKRRVENLRNARGLEHRQFSVRECEFRDGTDDDDGMYHFEGYASLFDTPYSVGGFTETISRGSFRRTLKEEPDVVFRVEHEGLPLARTERKDSDIPGTLRLEETSKGLLVNAAFDPLDTDAQRLKLKMERGLVDEMSFAFRCTDDDWNDELTDRKVKGVTLHGGDVSAVTFGASPSTGSTTSIRSTDGEFEVRAGKALSSAKEKLIQGLVDKLADAGDELSGLLPAETESDSVSWWEGLEANAKNGLLERVRELRVEYEAESAGGETEGGEDEPVERAAVPDLTRRAAQDLELLRLR